MIMNNRGYVTSGILVVILLFSLMYLAIVYGGVLNTSKDSAESGRLSDELVNDLNAKERIYSTLKDNISFSGDLSYPDLDREYTIETIDEEYESKEVFSSPYSSESFFISNRTNVNVEITVSPIDNTENFSYSAELNLGDKDIMKGEASNLSSNFSYTINADEIYNPSTGEVNYGDFNVNLTELNNCTVIVKVTYDELIKREVNVKGGSLDRNVSIISDKSGSVIEFTEGGN